MKIDKSDLRWCAEWHPYLWSGALEKVLGDPGRFRGRRVLELGARSGRMACWFGLQGARVLGLDLEHCDLEPATSYARDLGMGDSVRFANYDGNLFRLDPGEWDFVFTKSVLVVMPVSDAIPGIRRLLVGGGEYLACENMHLPFGLNRLRRYHRAGFTQRHLELLRRHFSEVRFRRHWGLVAALVARA